MAGPEKCFGSFSCRVFTPWCMHLCVRVCAQCACVHVRMCRCALRVNVHVCACEHMCVCVSVSMYTAH